MSPAVVEDKIFQALADPSRRAIFESLTRGDAAVKDLTSRFDISQPAVSQHLATLKDAGLVNFRREGRCVFYRAEPHGMKPLIDWVAQYRAFWTEHVDRLEELLQKMDEMNPIDKTAPSQTESLSFEFDLPHSPEKVWRALTDPVLLTEWLLPVVERELTLEPGAAFTFKTQPYPGWDGTVNCRTLEIEAYRKLSYTWVVGDMDTVVTFTLTPTASGTRLSLVQTGFRPDQKRESGGARYGWKMMGGKLVDLLARIP